MKKFILSIVFFILLIGSENFVFAADDIQINIASNITEWTTSNVMLVIDISSNKIFESESKQAVQILLGEQSETNKWVDLGVDSNALALKKSYTYIVKNNAKVSVRVVEWSKEDKTDLKELSIKTYEVSNIDKANPVIEKIDADISKNSIKLNILAKDLESGIVKYTCSCDELSYNKTLETSKFEFLNLKENKKYTFKFTVEDKMGNQFTLTKDFTTKSNSEENKNVVNNTNTNKNTNTNMNKNTNINNTNTNINTTVNNTNTDNTVANKIIPQIGKSQMLFAIILLLGMSIFIIKTKDRM